MCQPSLAESYQWKDVAQLKDEGRIVFVVENKVYCIDETFLHPGGNEVSSAILNSGSNTDCFFVDFP